MLTDECTADRFVGRLAAHVSPEDRDKVRRYFKTWPGDYGEGGVFIGVRMRDVFALAKEFVDMPPDEIESLLESPVHEVRAGPARCRPCSATPCAPRIAPPASH